MFARRILRHLDALRSRQPLPATVTLWTGETVPLGPEPRLHIRLNSPASARAFLNPSLDRLGEAFVEGDLDLDGSVASAIELASTLADQGRRHDRPGTVPGLFARHTRASDRRAIEHHYDVSNDFYALWLDPLMVYSCAYFPRGDEDLAGAQVAKLDYICRKLMLAPGLRLLDIGCGWGALAMHAARHHGARVLGITLSRNQYELARRRVEQAGLADRVEIRLQDYRDVPDDARFDRIASVGMFEHVGLGRLRGYFDTVHRLLEPGGIALNHGITSSDVDNRAVGRGAGEFIDRYVFPDGELPHVSFAIREMSAAGLEMVDAESLRAHYARTLGCWSEAFERHLPELTRLAGERRTRVWRVYLAGCAHAFAQGWINVYQLLAIRPRPSREGALSPLPMSRGHLYC